MSEPVHADKVDRPNVDPATLGPCPFCGGAKIDVFQYLRRAACDTCGASATVKAWQSIGTRAASINAERCYHGPDDSCPNCDPVRFGTETLSAGERRTDEQRVLDAICEASGYKSWFIARDLLMFERPHPTERGMLQAIPVHKIDFAHSASERIDERGYKLLRDAVPHILGNASRVRGQFVTDTEQAIYDDATLLARQITDYLHASDRNVSK